VKGNMAEASRHLVHQLLRNSDLAVNILEHARDVVMVADANLHLIYGNTSFQTVTGYTEEEWSNRRLDRFFVPESAQRVRRVFMEQRGSNTGPGCTAESSQPFEVRILTRRGDVVSFELQCSPIRDESGSVTALLGVARRINAQSSLEESLQFIERKYQDLFESSNDAIMILDKEGFFDCNRKTLEVFACPSKEKFTTLHPADLSPPQQQTGERSIELANRMIDLALEKGSHSFSWIHRRFSGESFPAEVSMSRFALAGRWVVQAMVRDVTDRIRAKEEALKSERRFADIINFLPDPTFAVDLNGRVIAWNRAMENLTGISGQGMLGKENYEYAIPFYRKRRPLMIDLLLKNDPARLKAYHKVHWAEGRDRSTMKTTKPWR